MNEDIILTTILLITCAVVGFLMYDTGRAKAINELCSRQQYDFCEVNVIIYKLKGIANDKD